MLHTKWPMQYPKQKDERKNILLLFGLGTLSLNTVILLLLFFNQTFIEQLTSQLTPRSLIELSNGQVITADPEVNLERQASTIFRFVGESLTLMLTSSPQIQSKKVLAITSSLLSASLKDQFATAILKEQRSLITGLSDRNVQTVLVIQKISQPTKIKASEWKIQVLAYQLFFSQSDLLGKSLPFNKVLSVRTIDKNKIKLPPKPLSLDLATYHLGEAKLEIFQICDIKGENCLLNGKT